MSLVQYYCNLLENKGVTSPSSYSMESKSASPTPTMMMLRGKPLPFTISSIVCYISLMMPSVMIRQMVYC